MQKLRTQWSEVELLIEEEGGGHFKAKPRWSNTSVYENTGKGLGVWTNKIAWHLARTQVAGHVYLSLNEKTVSFSRIKLNLKLGKHTPFQRLVSAPEASSVIRKERKACWESLVLCDLLSNGLPSRSGLVIK